MKKLICLIIILFSQAGLCQEGLILDKSIEKIIIPPISTDDYSYNYLEYKDLYDKEEFVFA